MKRIVIIIGAMIAAMFATAQAQDNKKTFTVEGNTYHAVKAQRTSGKQDTTVTTYTYEVKGTEYPIVLSKNGSAFVGRTSKKTGKYYRQYLGEEISRDICQKLGREYKGKTNNK